MCMSSHVHAWHNSTECTCGTVLNYILTYSLHSSQLHDACTLNQESFYRDPDYDNCLLHDATCAYSLQSWRHMKVKSNPRKMCGKWWWFVWGLFSARSYDTPACMVKFLLHSNLCNWKCIQNELLGNTDTSDKAFTPKITRVFDTKRYVLQTWMGQELWCPNHKH